MLGGWLWGAGIVGWVVVGGVVGVGLYNWNLMTLILFFFLMTESPQHDSSQASGTPEYPMNGVSAPQTHVTNDSLLILFLIMLSIFA